MTRFATRLTLAAAAFALTATASFAQNFADPQPVPFKVEKAQLGIKGPITKVCPNKATLTAWFFASKPGAVTFRYRKPGGGKSNWITINTKKGAGGINLATHVQVAELTKPTETKYMVEVKGYPVISPWVPLKASCSIGLGG
ncbi:MAG: hypothetical protein ABI399_01225 [Bauldia sp.]